MLDSYLAKRKMRVKELGVQSVFFTTIWRRDIIMGFFDTTTNMITQLTCFRSLGADEIEQLENVVVDYLAGAKKTK